MMKRIKRAITGVTISCVGDIKDKKLELPDYVSVMTESGCEIICERTKANFLAELILSAETLLNENDVNFSDYIIIVIQDDKRYKAAYTGSAICLHNLDAWMKANDEQVSKLLINVIHFVLLSTLHDKKSAFLLTLS